jgi:Tol biopolymer transport system component
VRRILSVVLVMTTAGVFAGQAAAQASGAGLGVFESQTDVGSVSPPGKLAYDATAHTYTIDSAGANLWVAEDDFHFVWKKVSGDVSLSADVSFPLTPSGASPHRKALLMFRQTLDSDSVYADAALHGNGETALQYRGNRGDTTQDIEFNSGPPKTLRLERRGDTITLFISQHGEPLHQAGASIKLHLDAPFYAGIGVCSHNKDAVERATFANVELKPLPEQPASAKPVLYSSLQTIAIDPNARVAKVVLTERSRIEAPNWTRDGKSLIFTRDGKLWTIPVEGGEARAIDIGDISGCTGSHGLSPDGKWLAVTCMKGPSPGPRIYIVPSSGGAPRMVTENPNSWFHSWSPDGKTLAFVRPNQGALNICTIPVEGGSETCITSGTGVSDDPDYSPDGQYIYFNSDRSGSVEIWRMRPDGSHPEQVTSDGLNNWTAHPSPDGESILILSYGRGVSGHPADKDVTLRILNAKDGKIRDLVKVVGGNGTDNVPNWAPDGKHFAFAGHILLLENDDGSAK